MRSEEELSTLRDNLVARCRKGRSKLFGGVRSILEEDDIPDRCSHELKTRIGKTLDDWATAIGLLEQYESQEEDPIWYQHRTLIEDFVSCLIPERYFPLVVKSDIVTNTYIHMTYWIFRLDWKMISDISHWCTLAHEAAHLPGIFPDEPDFAPGLTPELNEHARRLWIGDFPDTGAGWYREILNDLWSCYQTGPAYLWGTFDYFPTVAQDLNSGDLYHPPPNLRFALMARLLDTLGYSSDIIPDCPSLTSILPELRVNGTTMQADYFNDLSDELFRRDLIDYIERSSRSLFATVPNRRDEILESCRHMGNNEVLGNDIVADVSALSILCNVQGCAQDEMVDRIHVRYYQSS